MNKTDAARAFERLMTMVEILRAPGGCPWDREQSPMTLRSTLTEETYELVHAIQENDTPGIREELGDVFLNAVMIGEMAEGEHRFKLGDSLNEITDKLIRRHPHVFGSSGADTSEKVLEQWAQIKAKEKSGTKESLLHKAGRALPPLEKAQEVQKKAGKAGFDWPDAQAVLAKIHEEIEEVKAEMDSGDSHEKLEEELGDLLFAVVNLARHLKVDASLALNRTIEKFKARFIYIEDQLAREGKVPSPEHFDQMDQLWNQAKGALKKL